MEIIDYCDALNVELVIRYYPNQGRRFCVFLDKVDVMRGDSLESAQGNDRTVAGAVNRYIESIRGQRIAVNAYSVNRREFNVPNSLVA